MTVWTYGTVGGRVVSCCGTGWCRPAGNSLPVGGEQLCLCQQPPWGFFAIFTYPEEELLEVVSCNHLLDGCDDAEHCFDNQIQQIWRKKSFDLMCFYDQGKKVFIWLFLHKFPKSHWCFFFPSSFPPNSSERCEIKCFKHCYHFKAPV